MLTNFDKILFPQRKLSKNDLINYYLSIAPYILPLIKDHPISMFRFPDGTAGEKFFQKKIPSFFPQWIKRVKVPHRLTHESAYDFYPLCNDKATLAYLANYVCVPHAWLSRQDKLDYPDRLIFDIDPGAKTSFTIVRKVALWLKDFLLSLGLIPFAMLTGSRGMHIVVPIKRTHTFDEVRDFTRQIATIAAERYPKIITTEVQIHKRLGRLFIDYLRNGYGATSVAPYAVRDQPNAPVATPISWDEVADKKLHAQRYTIKNIFRKLEKDPDPWEHFKVSAVSITKPKKKLALYPKDIN